MAKLDPFHALRPTLARAPQVAAVPYDVVDRAEARALAAQQGPLSFLHVSRAEIDLPESVSPYSAEVYAQAVRALHDLTAAAPLARDAEPCLYIYRLEAGAHDQTGVAGLFSIAEYRAGIVRKHERTRPDKEDDRTRHLLALGAQTGPSYLAYRPRTQLKELTAQVMQDPPVADFVAADGVRHRVWTCSPGERQRAIVAEFAAMERLYIADGHHRAASAARAQDERGGAGSEGGFLAVAFPADELRILPYHRVVRELGMELVEFWNKVTTEFDVTSLGTPTADAVAPRRGEIGVFDGTGWKLLRSKRIRASVIGIDALDVSLLQNRILAPLLGITDPRTDARIDFVGGARGTAELERLVREGKFALAFAMHPTSLDELMAISDQNEIMPPKSTWFEPKLRDGLLIHTLPVQTGGAS